MRWEEEEEEEESRAELTGEAIYLGFPHLSELKMGPTSAASSLGRAHQVSSILPKSLALIEKGPMGVAEKPKHGVTGLSGCYLPSLSL